MKRGAAWEARLNVWHDAYRRDRQAWIVHAHPPVKLLSKIDARGRFRACFAGQGPPDYLGVLDNGRAVVFDAKDCTRSRWPLADLAPHQARDLEAAHDRGAWAFVALRLGGDGFVLPWSRLRVAYWGWREQEVAKRGTASLSRAGALEIGAAIPASGWLACFAVAP